MGKKQLLRTRLHLDTTGTDAFADELIETITSGSGNRHTKLLAQLVIGSDSNPNFDVPNDVRSLDARVPEKRRRGRQKIRWKDSCKRDIESAGLKEEDALDRTNSKRDIHNHSGDPR